jgi:hypothetical protein
VSIFFDYDAETGVTTHFDYDPIKDAASLTYTQDVTGFLDHMKSLRNTGGIWEKGIKEDWIKYASIPTVVELELLKKGLDLNKSEHHKAIFKEINQNYPYLKCVDKHHGG